MRRTEKLDYEVADMLRAVADPLRLRLLHLLAERGERKPKELAAALGLIQPVISYHLSVLRRLDLVNGHRRGHNVLYSLGLRIEVVTGGAMRLTLSGGGSIMVSRSGHASGAIGG